MWEALNGQQLFLQKSEILHTLVLTTTLARAAYLTAHLTSQAQSSTELTTLFCYFHFTQNPFSLGPLGFQTSSCTCPNRADRSDGHRAGGESSDGASPGHSGALTQCSLLQPCLHTLDLLLCPNLYNIFIFLFSATSIEPNELLLMSIKESVCVLFCGSLYILSALEMMQNLLPNPASLDSYIP